MVEEFAARLDANVRLEGGEVFAFVDTGADRDDAGADFLGGADVFRSVSEKTD